MKKVLKKSLSSKRKKKTLWDIAVELHKKPLIKVVDEDLVYGSNMMTRLMKESD